MTDKPISAARPLPCPVCGFDNPSDFHFCGGCGRPLLDDADLTRLPVTPGDAHLVERVFGRAGGQSGQRRDVTVLFADLTDYTSIARQLDSEEVYNLVAGFLGILVQEVDKYGGTIDKFTGDGIMALFGAPSAYENNAERGVRAAIDMQRTVGKFAVEVKPIAGVEPRMRIGLHTGSAIVGPVGVGQYMDYTAIGDTVNLARRLEEAAEPGTVLVSETVYRQTRALFHYHNVGPIHPKGFGQQSVPAYQVAGFRERPGRLRGIEGLNAPLVDREREMAQLVTASQQWAERKVGQIALITGEVGIGKTRLVYELRRYLSDRPVLVLEGGGLSYRGAIPYWVFREIFFDLLGLDSGDSLDLQRHKVEDGLSNLLGRMGAEFVPDVEYVLGLRRSAPPSTQPGGRNEQLVKSLRDVLIAAAARQPLMLILDDLHWADPGSLELIIALLPAVTLAPLFFVCLSRWSENQVIQRIYAATSSQDLAGRRTVISLDHLPIAQTDVLIERLLGKVNLPRALHREIHARAAGNPFFLEEVLSMLIDEGILCQAGDTGEWTVDTSRPLANIGVPETLRGTVMAHFDRLSEADRALLQMAAVMGFRFSCGPVWAALGREDPQDFARRLLELQQAEFIVADQSAPGDRFRFCHVIAWETVLGSLLRRDRERLESRLSEVVAQAGKHQ
jgi:class 3 adenylate cyclase